ncbi:pectin lyase fold/virulence factor [Lucifera butyrica]|uniref:Pectin lyase fold/virulence factor n=1 Tax=Lucifera butyrica TaxID=1351585 RepID=A0A498RGS5_9FIRM|nr:LptA/OstA family protein [Lucifera butyrica]VBB09282.1 pectin lyase fold/virulence factor [Lucifera butyrica]
MKRKLWIIPFVILFSLSMAAKMDAAQQSQPVELAADTIEYDSAQGVMTANGGVVTVTRGNAVMTGTSATYNTKTKEAEVSGGVKVVQDDATLTAPEVRSFEDNHIVATGGNVVLVKGEDTLYGPLMEYYVDKQYAIVPQNGKLVTADSVMTADKIEAFTAENRAVATGSVHIVSEQRQLDATGDQAVYYGNGGQKGKVVLSGNARAVQQGNVLTGNRLVIYLDNKKMDSEGRSQLVVTPQ